MLTVREYLKTGKFNGVHITSPGGFVDLTNEQVKDLLAGRPVTSHLGVRDSDMVLDNEELLEEVICEDIQTNKDGSVAFLTEYIERM